MIPKDLYFENELVASLSDSYIEWPRSQSIYKINAKVRSELIDYIQQCLDYSILLDKSDENAMKKHVATEELKFLHLINSEEWFLIDQNDKKHEILVPMFHPENCVVWMRK